VFFVATAEEESLTMGCSVEKEKKRNNQEGEERRVWAYSTQTGEGIPTSLVRKGNGGKRLI